MIPGAGNPNKYHFPKPARDFWFVKTGGLPRPFDVLTQPQNTVIRLTAYSERISVTGRVSDPVRTKQRIPPRTENEGGENGENLVAGERFWKDVKTAETL